MAINRAGALSRCHQTSLPASLAMSICQHILLSWLSGRPSVQYRRRRRLFADRYLHVYIKPSENRSIGEGGGREHTRKEVLHSSPPPSIHPKKGEGPGDGVRRVCAQTKKLALLFLPLFFPTGVCDAQRLRIRENSSRNLSNQCNHFLLVEWGGR
jgi:hypothetical protein